MIEDHENADPVRPGTAHTRWASTPATWLITAATIAIPVCLVGWPRPTLYALGLLTGATALLVGLRLLAAEHPRKSGPGADTAREQRRHALAFNALTRVLSAADEYVRLSVRDEAARAVLTALDSDSGTRPSHASRP
jgi:hypothetical protein